MRMKSFAMLAMTGLLTASFAYIAPAMADDTSDQATDNTMQQNQNTDPNMNNNNPSSSDMNNPNNSTSGSNNDAGMPDTATGDDDY